MKEHGRVRTAGHELVCFVCQGELFERRTMTLVTSGFANSGFNKTGQLAVCTTCGYVHVFFPGAPLVWEPSETSEP